MEQEMIDMITNDSHSVKMSEEQKSETNQSLSNVSQILRTSLEN